MNSVKLTGRPTADPDIRLYGDNNDKKMARYLLAVDRRVKRDPNNQNQQTADFVSCICYGYAADFADKYLRKGMKILVEGRIATGKYQNKEGQTVYTTDVVVDQHEFCDSKGSSSQGQAAQTTQATTSQPQQIAQAQTEPFINIPDDVNLDVPFA